MGVTCCKEASARELTDMWFNTCRDNRCTHAGTRQRHTVVMPTGGCSRSHGEVEAPDQHCQGDHGLIQRELVSCTNSTCWCWPRRLREADQAGPGRAFVLTCSCRALHCCSLGPARPWLCTVADRSPNCAEVWAQAEHQRSLPLVEVRHTPMHLRLPPPKGR